MFVEDRYPVFNARHAPLRGKDFIVMKARQLGGIDSEPDSVPDSVFSRVTPVAAAPPWNVHAAPTRPYRLDDLVAAAQALGLPEDGAHESAPISRTPPVCTEVRGPSGPWLYESDDRFESSGAMRVRNDAAAANGSRRRTISRIVFATALAAVVALLGYEGWIVSQGAGGVEAWFAAFGILP